MTAVFISYRRDDTQDVAARLADRLRIALGRQNVFLDVEGLAPGDHFPERLRDALRRSDVVLLLIGDAWTGPSPSGGPPRIASEGDFVRMETREALASGRRVIPVLVNGASPPPDDALPEDIRGVTSLNALFLRHESFSQDYEILLRGVDPAAARRMRSGGGSVFVRGAIGVVLGAALLLVTAVAHHEITGGAALETTLGSRGLTYLVAAAIALLGFSLPFLLRRGARGS